MNTVIRKLLSFSFLPCNRKDLKHTSMQSQKDATSQATLFNILFNNLKIVSSKLSNNTIKLG